MKISLKLTIILLFVVLLPGVIVTYINFYSTQKVMTKVIQNHLEGNVKQRVENANDYAQHLIKGLMILSEDALLKYSLENNTTKSLSNLMNYSLKEHQFYDMFLIEDDATIVFSIKKESDFNQNLNAEPLKGGKFSLTYQEAIKTKKPAISNFTFYKPSNKYAAFIVIPILSDSKILGALAAQIDMDEFLGFANNYGGLGKSGEILLGQKSNNKIVIINKLRYDDQPIFTRSIKIGSTKGKPMQNAIKGCSGNGISIDYKNVEVIAAWGYIKSFKIGMVIKIDTDEAYAEIFYLKKLTMFMGVIILFFLLYVIYHIKKIVSSLEEAKNQYAFAVNGTHDGLWDWDIKNSSIYFSPRAKEMLGYDDSYEISLQKWESIVHPDDLEATKRFIKECHSNPNKEYNTTYRARHKDGHYIWMLDRGKTYFDSEGNANRMLGFHTDITKSKSLEEELKSSKLQFEQFMHYIPAKILIKDNDGVVIYANENANKFFNQDNIIGKRAVEFVDSDMAKYIQEFDEKVMQNSIFENIKEIRNENSESIFIRALGFKIEINNNIGIGLVILDITQSYIYKQELQNKEEIMIAQSRHAAMGEMISMIAHQWRQPISIISMDANNVLADIELDNINISSLKEEVIDIVEQTQYLSKTIDDFRDFFKPNKLKDEVLVSDIFEEALKVIGKSLVNNNIQIENNFNSNTKVFIFSRELLQVFLNLLKNAKESLLETKEFNRKIINTIYEDEANIIIEVVDNGLGIDDKIIDNIFDPYFSTKDEKNGTGLGLYISKIIIEKHLSGYINVIKKDDNTCFRITIPKVVINLTMDKNNE